MTIALTILAWTGWLIITSVSLFFGLMFLAFGGDAPRPNRALQWSIPVIFAVVLGCIAGAAKLILAGQWWQVVLAYVLSAAPPLVIWFGISVIYWWLAPRPERQP